MSGDLDTIFNEVETEMSDTDVDNEVDIQVESGSDEPVVESGTDADDVELVDTETDNTDDGAGEEVWNWEEFADQLVPRTVNGETEMVPLKEAIEGSMRHADYTRKTQEVAEQAKAAKWAADMQDALARDPRGTLEVIAQAYGLLDPQPQRPQAEESHGFRLEDLDEDVRPWAEKTFQAEQQMLHMQRQLENLEMERLKGEVRAEIEGLRAQWGDQFNAEQVLQLAAQRNMTLTDAQQLLMGQKYLADRNNQSEAERIAAEAAKTAEQARSQRKRTASSSTKSSFQASEIPVDDFNTIDELMEQIMAAEV